MRFWESASVLMCLTVSGCRLGLLVRLEKVLEPDIADYLSLLERDYGVTEVTSRSQTLLPQFRMLGLLQGAAHGCEVHESGVGQVFKFLWVFPRKSHEFQVKKPGRLFDRAKVFFGIV